MPRTIYTLAAAITALVICAPAPPAMAVDEPVRTPSASATTSAATQHPRSPNAREAAYPTPCDIAAALAQEAYYMGKPAPRTPAKRCLRWRNAQDAARPKTPSDITAALAHERYYSSYGEPELPAPPTGAAEIRTHNNRIAPTPFVVAVVGALIVGLAAGSGLQLLRARRRNATDLAT